MATIALTAAFGGAASALGATGTLAGVLTGVGTALGSYIDQTFLLPALFPQPDIEGPRLSDVRTQFAEEGSPQNIALGGESRTNCTVIWISDLLETKNTDRVGGKGGGGQKVTSYAYFLSMAVAFANCRNTAAVDEVVEIIASGKTIYRKPEVITFTGSVTASSPVTIDGQAVWDVTYSGGTDLSSFVPGGQVVVTGFTNPSNNGTFDIVSATGDAGAGTSRLRLQNSAGVNETAGATFTQDTASFNEGYVEDIQVYLGGTGQSPDPTIESFEGAGNVPAWRGTAYIVLTNLALAEFGNFPPQINVIFNAGTSQNAGGMINTLAAVAGLGADWADVSEITETVQSYPIQGVVDVSKAIQPITIAANLLAQQFEDGLRFFPRARATIIDIPAEYLTARELGSQPSEVPLQVEDLAEHEMPSAVVVRYIDKDNRLQGGSQRAPAEVDGVSGTERVVNLPLALTDSGAEARALAQRLIYDAAIRRQVVKLSLPYKWLRIQENDLLRIRTMDHTWLLLVRRVDHGANFLIQLECTVEIREVFTQEGVADPVRAGTIHPSLEGHPIISTIGTPTPTPTPGPGPVPNPRPRPPHIIPVYIHTDEERFDTTAVLWSKPEDADDSEYEELGTMSMEGVLGFTPGTLYSGSDVTGNMIDRTTTFDVELFGGSLSSLGSDEDWFDGKLALLVGDEVVFAKTATLISERLYRISNLLRGQLGTQDQVQNHGVGDRVVLLNHAAHAENAVEVPTDWVGRSRSFKLVPPGRALSEMVEHVLDMDDLGTKPLAVVNMVANRDTSGNITLSWDRVGKYARRLFETQPTLEPFPSEEYDIEVRATDGGPADLTIRVVDATLYDLDQTDLTAVGIASSDTVYVTIYQINRNRPGDGRGFSAGALEVDPAPIP